MSNLLTTDRSLCLHDASRCTPTAPLLRPVLDGFKYEYVGSSDNAIPMFLDSVLREFPGAPIAFIQRDPWKVRESLHRRFAADADRMDRQGRSALLDHMDRTLDLLAEGLRWGIENGLGPEFSFDELEDDETIEQLWRHVIPTVPYDPIRVRLLQTLRIDHVDAVYRDGISDSFRVWVREQVEE
jgi:hypothetical protein